MCKRDFGGGNRRRRRKFWGLFCAAGENFGSSFHPFCTICAVHWAGTVRDRQTLWLRHTNRHFRRTKFGFFFRRWMLRVLRPITTHAADSLVQCLGNASTPLALKYGDTAAQRATSQAYGPWERNHHGTSQPGVSMRGRGSMHTAAPPVPSLRSLHSPTHPSIRSLHFPSHP